MKTLILASTFALIAATIHAEEGVVTLVREEVSAATEVTPTEPTFQMAEPGSFVTCNEWDASSPVGHTKVEFRNDTMSITCELTSVGKKCFTREVSNTTPKDLPSCDDVCPPKGWTCPLPESMRAKLGIN